MSTLVHSHMGTSMPKIFRNMGTGVPKGVPILFSCSLIWIFWNL